LALIAVVFNGRKLSLVITKPRVGLDGVSKRLYSTSALRLAHSLVCIVTTKVDQLLCGITQHEFSATSFL